MPKLGDIVTYMTTQGQPRVAFVSAEVVELPAEEEEAPVPVAADQQTSYQASSDGGMTQTPVTYQTDYNGVTSSDAPIPVAADEYTSTPQVGEPYVAPTEEPYTSTPVGEEYTPIPVAGEEQYTPTATPDVSLSPEEQAAEQARIDEAKAAKEAHTQAELQAGGPIQRVEIVNVAALQPLPDVPVVVETPPLTGPALTLHVLLHVSDADYARFGALAAYVDVPHSDKFLPHTWH